MKQQQTDRRKQPRKHDTLYKIVVAINVFIWVMMVIALGLYHYGRPELSLGFYEYLNIQVRTSWKQEYYWALVTLLQVCLVLTLATSLLRAKRSRRKHDHFGFNLFFLVFIIVVSLITLLF